MKIKKQKPNTVLGMVHMVDGKKRFVPKSPEYMTQVISKLPLNKIISCTFDEKKPTRSQSQLSYYAVIIQAIADQTGYTWEETHETLMIAKWGKKKVKIGKYEEEVRKSVSDSAQMPKYEMTEQIMFAKEVAQELNIRLATPEELGYISNT